MTHTNHRTYIPILHPTHVDDEGKGLCFYDPIKPYNDSHLSTSMLKGACPEG